MKSSFCAAKKGIGRGGLEWVSMVYGARRWSTIGVVGVDLMGSPTLSLSYRQCLEGSMLGELLEYLRDCDGGWLPENGSLGMALYARVHYICGNASGHIGFRASSLCWSTGRGLLIKNFQVQLKIFVFTENIQIHLI
ncbi:hypothetical protein [Falsiporphyromonas endometrii]|uniref:Uncharacterized protein n=1 Tax=Falsiporphyromonas endometrii TaxID=1387297 RepID=A0ABV9K6H8_9PORP